MAISFGDTKYYIVSHRGAGHSLNVHGNNTITNNRNVNIYYKERTDSQRWIVKLQSPGAKIYSALVTQAYALDYYRGSSNYGNADVYIADGNDQDSLVDLRTVDAANNLYRIQLVNYPTLYLTAMGNTSGSDVRWAAYDEANAGQVWKFVPVRFAHYFLTATRANEEQVQETIDYMEDCGYEVSRSDFPLPLLAYSALQYSKLWVIHGHGETGRTLFQVSYAEERYNHLYASHFNAHDTTSNDRFLNELPDGALSNTVFGLFTSCFSAAGADYNNMAKTCYDKSAGNATIAGYSREVAAGEDFSQMLFWHLMQGKTIGAAISAAATEFNYKYPEYEREPDVDYPTDEGNFVVYGTQDKYVLDSTPPTRSVSIRGVNMDAVAAAIANKTGLMYSGKWSAKDDGRIVGTDEVNDEKTRTIYYFKDQSNNRYGYNGNGELVVCEFNPVVDYSQERIAPSDAIERALDFARKLMCEELVWVDAEAKESWANGYRISAKDACDRSVRYIVATNASGEIISIARYKAPFAETEVK